MLILLPPSEGKAVPSRGKPLDLEALSFPALNETRRRILDDLTALCGGEQEQAAQTLGLGATQLDLVARNAALEETPTARADAVYTGVLYDALDLGSLTTAAKRRARSRIGIASALFGLLSPADRIPAYRLSGDAALPGVGTLASNWRPVLGQAVVEAVGSGLLVDLRSGMYANLWRPTPDTAAKVASVRVLHEHNGTRKVVSHFNKATKGRIVRALMEEGASPRTPSALADVLRDLGWQVEQGSPGAKGTELDVVVRDL
ncbi:peroxide stress protein YaaA [Nocardioides gilvus]|uniref:peroxide stress protein YaaA n=1 Tax=Nocardioides gilvus TaxID=1735589 RepID=UPI000D74F4B5|nr:peroxide stress protein YaaA [Nocardioides gilvus]